jgi:hypothetical protein
MTELSGSVSCMVELMGDPLYEKRFFQGAKGHTGACFDKDFIVWYYRTPTAGVPITILNPER